MVSYFDNQDQNCLGYWKKVAQVRLSANGVLADTDICCAFTAGILLLRASWLLHAGVPVDAGFFLSLYFSRLIWGPAGPCVPVCRSTCCCRWPWCLASVSLLLLQQYLALLLVHLLLFASLLLQASQLHDLAFANVPIVDDVLAVAGVLYTALAAC